jgi:hypothetical protein
LYSQFQWCLGLPTDVLDLKYVRITPEVIHPGDELTLEAGGYLSKDVKVGSEADVQVKLGVVRLIKKTFDICDELDKHKDDVQIQCPITQGEHVVS